MVCQGPFERTPACNDGILVDVLGARTAEHRHWRQHPRAVALRGDCKLGFELLRRRNSGNDHGRSRRVGAISALVLIEDCRGLWRCCFGFFAWDRDLDGGIASVAVGIEKRIGIGVVTLTNATDVY